MKIAMIGSGATGSVFASFLKLGGADIYLVDTYKAHMDAIAQSGMKFENAATGQTHILTGFHTAYDASQIGVMDIVIILVKTTGTDTVMPSVMPAVGPDTVVLSLQNGFGNEEVLKKYVPASRIMYGSGIVGTELPEPGHCIGRPFAPVWLHFGALENNAITNRAGKYLLETFERGGCMASFDEDIRFFVWNKAIGNSLSNALQGIVRMPSRYMYDENSIWIKRAVLREGCNVANAAGVDGEKIWDNWSKQNGPSELEVDYYPSTAQDMLMYKRQTEIDSFNGAIVMYGKRYGVPTPVNETITRMVKHIQSHYDGQYREPIEK